MSPSSQYIACIKCTKLLVPAPGTDGASHATKAGWQATAGGWICPKHLPATQPAAEVPSKLAA